MKSFQPARQTDQSVRRQEKGDPVNANDCLKQVNDRYALFQTLWNMYFAVSFGLLAFLVSAKFSDALLLWSVKVVAILTYGCFAYCNLGGLKRVRNEHDLLGSLFLRLAIKENLQEPELVDAVSGLPRYHRLPAERRLVATYLLACGLVALIMCSVPPYVNL